VRRKLVDKKVPSRFAPKVIHRRVNQRPGVDAPCDSSAAMRIAVYILLVVPSLIGAALLWDHVAVDKLFYCSDSCGPIDFIPPFVHSVAGDHYIAPAWFVWVLWTALLVLALALPAVAIGGSSWIYGFAKRTQKAS